MLSHTVVENGNGKFRGKGKEAFYFTKGYRHFVLWNKPQRRNQVIFTKTVFPSFYFFISNLNSKFSVTEGKQ